MTRESPDRTPQSRSRRRPLALTLCGASLALLAGVYASTSTTGAPHAKAAEASFPPVPKDGTMGFVVSQFVPAVLQESGACPNGLAPKLRDEYLLTLPDEERKRLQLQENQHEFDRRWQATAFGPHGTNICSQPDMFDRPMLPTVKSSHAIGLDLDGDASGAGGADTCAHENFTTPAGAAGVDNQAYRALGCTVEWRGIDGKAGDMVRGFKQFFTSGEWTQVILIKGVDSLVRDDDVEVIYGNTPDRPSLDSKGEFLPGMSFSISDTAPRHRNVLHGRIRDGVLTTDPTDIKLAQTWGQGGARDIRGNRSSWDLRRARLRLTFRPDGSLGGLVGGYQPVFQLLQSPALGGAGSAIAAGIDCAGELKTLRAMADGIKDPKTGHCTGVSTALQLQAVPAFVNDLPASTRTASR